MVSLEISRMVNVSVTYEPSDFETSQEWEMFVQQCRAEQTFAKECLVDNFDVAEDDIVKQIMEAPGVMVHLRTKEDEQ